MTTLVVPQEQAEKRIEAEIKKRHNDAKKIKINIIQGNLTDANAYYAEFVSKEEKKADSFYYAYIDKERCLLLEDGEAMVEHFENLLEKRKNLLQRLSEFDFLDIVGAIIALLIVGAFVILIVVSKDSANAISKEFLALVSIVLGYYFGRNKK